MITVSYGSAEALEVFLRSLRELHGAAVPLMVVDNKPDHENVRELAERFSAAYLPLPANPGYGAGMNAGVRELARLGTVPEAVFFCNPDVRFLEPVIEPLARALLADPVAGSIGPQLLNEDGTVYPSARRIPSLATGLGHALLARIWRGNPWTRAYQNAAAHDARRTAGSLSGAAVMVKRSVFEELSGFDEGYFMHFEDIDLGYRIGLAGRTNVYDPSVRVEHSGAHSTRKHAAVVERAMTRSAIRFMGTRYPGARNAPLRVAIGAGLRLRGALRLASIRSG